VPKENREQIFEPLRRLQQIGGLPGSGLGLATCAKIAERHKGRIRCDPDVLTGTTIHVTLGLDPAAAEPARPAALSRRPLVRSFAGPLPALAPAAPRAGPSAGPDAAHLAAIRVNLLSPKPKPAIAPAAILFYMRGETQGCYSQRRSRPGPPQAASRANPGCGAAALFHYRFRDR
jgi:hypothetical protein